MLVWLFQHVGEQSSVPESIPLAKLVWLPQLFVHTTNMLTYIYNLHTYTYTCFNTLHNIAYNITYHCCIARHYINTYLWYPMVPYCFLLCPIVADCIQYNCATEAKWQSEGPTVAGKIPRCAEGWWTPNKTILPLRMTRLCRSGCLWSWPIPMVVIQWSRLKG